MSPQNLKLNTSLFLQWLQRLRADSGIQDLSDPLRGLKIAFDFDGTLAPYAQTSLLEHAKMRARTAELLAKLASQATVAILSGRGRKDLQQKLRQSFWSAALSPSLASAGESLLIIGNHGAEWPEDHPLAASPIVEAKVESEVKRAAAALRILLRDFPEVQLEVKRMSLSVILLDAPIEQDALVRDQTLDLLRSQFPGWSDVGGKRILNLMPPGSPNKGTALSRWMQDEACLGALYFGDDLNDEAVFELQRADLFSVRIGFSEATAAKAFLPEQSDLDEFLEILLKGLGSPG